jgi:hypothetical protein
MTGREAPFRESVALEFDRWDAIARNARAAARSPRELEVREVAPAVHSVGLRPVSREALLPDGLQS